MNNVLTRETSEFIAEQLMNLQTLKYEKILLVEGETDKYFLNKFYVKGVHYEPVKNIYSNKCYFKNRNNINNNLNISNKNNIYQLIFYLNFDNKKSKIYGLIDKDEDFSNTNLKRLFITDTHDLETTLLSIDNKLIYQIPNCKVTKSDVCEAMFIAYQLSFLVKLLHKENLLGSSELFNNPKDWNKFIDNKKINIKKFLGFLKSEIKSLGMPGSRKNINKIKNLIDLDNFIKKFPIVKNKIKGEYFKFDINNFHYDNINFWDMVNGHYIAKSLAFINNTVYNFYNKYDGNINRVIELEWIKRFDKNEFKNTTLAGKLLAEGLITFNN